MPAARPALVDVLEHPGHVVGEPELGLHVVEGAGQRPFRKAAFVADYAASSSWLPALIDEVLASSRLPAGVHGGPEVAVVDLADASPEVVA